MRSDDHLSETELIRFADGETSAEESRLFADHLETCAGCRAGFAEMQHVSEKIRGLNRDTAVGSPVTSPGEARSLLKTRLIQARDTSSEPFSVRALGVTRTKLFSDYFYGAVAAAGIAAIFLFVPGLHRSVADTAVSLPNRALTPGMTRPVNVQEMCTTGDEDLDPEVPYSTQKAVFTEYGISIDHSAKDFQVDYLISPQLGGTDDVRNLWPQSYKETTWNAHAKDKLERHLYQLVCEKKIDLTDAQHEIATNWIAAYQKYFRTSRPT